MTECVVYWKHTEDMCHDYTDGYIGITNNFEERMKQHHRDAFVRNSSYTVHERMRTYNEDVVTDIIFEGSRKDCEQLEFDLRKRWHVGWNMCMGGGSPAKERWYSPRWLDTRLYNITTRKEVIIDHKTGYWLREMAKEHLPNKTLKAADSGLFKVLAGTSPQFENWEFANKQLVMKVRDKLFKRWNHMFLRKVNEPNHVVSIHRSGVSFFCKSINLTPQVMNMQRLSNGSAPTAWGWELASEEEWLATTERLEFK